MKQLCMTLTGALAALAVASCNKTDSAMPNGGGNPSDGRVAVHFTAGGLDVRPAASTRGDWTIRDGKIGIYVLDATESTIADGYANVGYLFDAERRIFVPVSETIYFPVDGSKRRFVAYSPCREVVDGLFKVDLGEQPAPEEQGARELLWTDVTPAYDKTTPDVRLEFKHQYAKLTVRVKNGAGLTGEDLKGLVVSISGMQLKADFQLLTGKMTPTGDPGVLTLRGAAADGSVHTALVLPTEPAEKRTMNFKLGDDTFFWNIADKRFEAGKTYEYTVTANRTALGLLVTVADWEEGETGIGVAE